MTLGEGLRRFVLADPVIASIVGTQMFPGLRALPQSVLKSPSDPSGAITYGRFAGGRATPLKGVATLAQPLLQIDSWARSQDRATELGSFVRQRLDAFNGYWGDEGSPGSVRFFVQIRFLTERDETEQEINGGLGLHTAEYQISHGTAGGRL